MDVLIEQSLDVTPEAQRLLAGLAHAQSDVTAADARTPNNDEHNNCKNGCNCVQKDHLGIVALNIFINTGVIIPNFLGSTIAQAGKHFEPEGTAEVDDEHIPNKDGFNSQEDQTLDDLTGGNIAKTHDQHGKPDQGAAIFQRIQQRGGVLSLLLLSGGGLC